MPNPSLDLAIGMVIVILGISFTYKFYQATLLGKCTYWTGFLPITMISPWLTHIPSTSKRSLTKTAQGLWVHLLMGPIFLICAVLCFAAGTEIMGLPGMNTLNWVLNGGNTGRATCVAFDKHSGFRFPFLKRSSEVIGKRISKVQLGIKAGDEMLPSGPQKSIKQQMDEGSSASH
jgi:hypothetical protein